MAPRMRTIQEAAAELRRDHPVFHPPLGTGRHNSPCKRRKQAPCESGHIARLFCDLARSRTGNASVWPDSPGIG